MFLFTINWHNIELHTWFYLLGKAISYRLHYCWSSLKVVDGWSLSQSCPPLDLPPPISLLGLMYIQIAIFMIWHLQFLRFGEYSDSHIYAEFYSLLCCMQAGKCYGSSQIKTCMFSTFSSNGVYVGISFIYCMNAYGDIGLFVEASLADSWMEVSNVYYIF